MGRPRTLAPPTHCQLCMRPASADPTRPLKVHRFYLTTKAKTAEGRPSSRGAGVIDLCERCWRGVKASHPRIR